MVPRHAPYAETVKLRGALGGLIAQGVPDSRLQKLYEMCLRDEDLAVTACTLVPRPEWLKELVGESPIPDYPPSSKAA